MPPAFKQRGAIEHQGVGELRTSSVVRDRWAAGEPLALIIVITLFHEIRP